MLFVAIQNILVYNNSESMQPFSKYILVHSVNQRNIESGIIKCCDYYRRESYFLHSDVLAYKPIKKQKRIATPIKTSSAAAVSREPALPSQIVIKPTQLHGSTKFQHDRKNIYKVIKILARVDGVIL